MEVKQYGKFEIILERVSKSGYPYTETELSVEFVSPDSEKISFWGFYDGGDVWKIRFMPKKIGKWSYSAYFSDAPEVKYSGEFLCVKGENHGLISSDRDNPMWFGYEDGTHFFMRSFHVGDCFFAENWPQSRREEFLDWAKKQGYNTLSVASFFVNRQTFGRGMGWDTPSLWPLDAEKYKKLERLLDTVREYGFVVFPFAGFFGREGFNPTSLRDQERYVKYVIARLGCYDNLLFNVAGPEPLLDVNPFMPESEVDRLGELIAKYDIYHHLLTVHNQTGDDRFADKKYQTFTTLQGPKTVSLPELRRGLMRNHPKASPLYAQETLWTDNKYGHPLYTDTELRRNAYVIALSAASLNYGDMMGDSSSGFSGRPELELKVQRRHDIVKAVWDNVTRFPYYRLSPDDTAVPGAFALVSRDRSECLFFSSGKDRVTFDLIPGEAYEATVIRTDRLSAEYSIKVTGEMELPDAGDYLVYLKI